jgi:diaminohydroxyphosphoribosylaminopyrimidine deaminase/5-amino-6-(5-phosphoribosylamino)uracil reductase
VRVVLDSALRLPVASRLVETARETPVWVIAGEAAQPGREHALRTHGVEVMRVPASASAANAGASGASRLDVGAALRLLARRGITRLMVEGGPTLAASLVSADLVDEALLFRSPHLIGGGGIDALEGLRLTALTRSPHFVSRGTERLGLDTVESFERG